MRDVQHAQGRREILVGKPKRRDHVGERGVCERLMLKGVLHSAMLERDSSRSG